MHNQLATFPISLPTQVQEYSLKKNSQFIQQNFNIHLFKQKYIFQPYQYPQALQQTLTHQLKSLNPKSLQLQAREKQQIDHKQSLIFDRNFPHQGKFLLNGNNNVHFKGHNYLDSFNSTSKSIKTNKTIWGADPIDTPKNQKNNFSTIIKGAQNLGQVNEILNKSLLGKPPNLLMKKQSSITTNSKSQVLSSLENQNTNNFERNKNRIVFNGRQMQKKTLFNKQKYIEGKVDKTFKQSYKSHVNQNNRGLNSQQRQLASASLQYGSSLCQSIALGSTLVQNFMKSTYQNGFFNNQPMNTTMHGSKNPSLVPQPLSFYGLCMLLFPQTSKSIPCSVFIMDTLFYAASNDSKEIIYIFKDRRRNLLIKMKNKNKSAYELFMKRRQNYETNKIKQDKLRKAGYFKQKQQEDLINKQKSSQEQNKNVQKLKKQCKQKQKNQGQQKQRNYESLTPRKFVQSLKCLEDEDQFEKSQYLAKKENQNECCAIQEQIYNQSQQQFVQTKSHVKKYQGVQWSQSKQFNELLQKKDGLQSLNSLNGLRQKVSKLSFQVSNQNFYTYNNLGSKTIAKIQGTNVQTPLSESPIITPSNSVRQSLHSLQTNYVALLKYNNNHIIRLKSNEFKAIFHNPLYANERFKNNNNTQYIQSLPIQDQYKDLKVYSMHFHYQIFKNQQLFIYVKDSLYKQNQYTIANGNRNYEEPTSGSNNCKSSKNRKNYFDSTSIQRRNSLRLKQKLKQISIQIYLYYQIFEMYTYISMHYNKQILNGTFRFILHQNDYALFETQNLIFKDMPRQGEFIKAKIFQQNDFFNKNDALDIAKKPNKVGQDLKAQNNSTANSSQSSGISTPGDTMKKINKELLKLAVPSNLKESQLQKQLALYFTSENNKIEKQMNTYFNDKIQKIKNVKDMHLSKNIFKIINQNISLKKEKENANNPTKQQNYDQFNKVQVEKEIKQCKSKNIISAKQNNQNNLKDQNIDFHELLNNQKLLEKFLKKKELTDQYSRKNISNYSVVRWKKELSKAKQRKSVKQNENILSFDYENKLQSQNQGACKKYKINKENSYQISVSQPKKSKSLRSIEVNIGKSYDFNISTANKLQFSAFCQSNLKQLSQNQLKSFQNKLLYASYAKKKDLKKSQSNRQLQFAFNPLIQGDNQKQAKQMRKYKKKLIQEKYSQFNKSKFKLKAFKADRFI